MAAPYVPADIDEPKRCGRNTVKLALVIAAVEDD